MGGGGGENHRSFSTTLRPPLCRRARRREGLGRCWICVHRIALNFPCCCFTWGYFPATKMYTGRRYYVLSRFPANITTVFTHLCVRVSLRVYVRACVYACVRVCVCACVRAAVRSVLKEELISR